MRLTSCELQQFLSEQLVEQFSSVSFDTKVSVPNPRLDL
nr:MAG TPA: hypothetical protein [Caudoviricetes sp.]